MTGNGSHTTDKNGDDWGMAANDIVLPGDITLPTLINFGMFL